MHYQFKANLKSLGLILSFGSILFVNIHTFQLAGHLDQQTDQTCLLCHMDQQSTSSTPSTAISLPVITSVFTQFRIGHEVISLSLHLSRAPPQDHS